MNIFEIKKKFTFYITKNLHLFRFIYLFLKGKNQKKFLVTKNTDLVIEGFPRSGNSFFEAFINVVFPNLILAHHTHRIAQIRLAIIYKKPVIFLIRKPSDALISYYNFYERKIRFKHILTEYNAYHKSLIKYKKKLLIIRFEEINDKKRIINKINSELKLEINKKINLKKISKEQILSNLLKKSNLRHNNKFRESYVDKKKLKKNFKSYNSSKKKLYEKKNLKLLNEANEIYNDFIK